jgi:hypothetical protein
MSNQSAQVEQVIIRLSHEWVDVVDGGTALLLTASSPPTF